MISISRLLHESNYTEELCSLCLNTGSELNKHFKLKDNVVLNINTVIVISDMLLFTLGENVLNILVNDSICMNCTKTLVSCYTFVKKCRENVQQFNRVYEALNNSITHTTSKDDQTMFVVLNITEFTSNTYCTIEKCTTKTALPTFYSIHNETNLFNGDSWNSDAKKKNKRKKYNIKTKDMVLDSNSQELKCKVCLKIFLRQYNLRAHYIRIHAPKIFKCEKCNKKYSTEVLLKQHNKENHSSVVCSECGKAFTNLPTLKSHESSHKLKIICADCGRTYKRPSTFKKHKQMNVCGQLSRKSNSDAAYVCDICNKRYCQKSALRVHIQFEHGNGKAHICNWCNKKFSAESLLKAHIVTHTKQKNFSCNICNGKYVTKESLRYHIRTHTGESPYKCRQCECRFLSASRRIEHVRKCHLNLESCKICFKKSLPIHNKLQKVKT